MHPRGRNHLGPRYVIIYTDTTKLTPRWAGGPSPITMNIYYRGYVIHKDDRSTWYTVYDRRPYREEVANMDNAIEAMRWVDQCMGLNGVMELAWFGQPLPTPRVSAC